jgi:hypothetical protein
MTPCPTWRAYSDVGGALRAAIELIPAALQRLSETFLQRVALRARDAEMSSEQAYGRMVNTEMREGPRRLHTILTLELLITREVAAIEAGTQVYDVCDMCALGYRALTQTGATGGKKAGPSLMRGFIVWVQDKLLEGRA